MTRTTPPDAARVAAASAAWIWVPDQARSIETDDFLLVRYPDWFFHPLELARFDPSGDVEQALDAALAAARSFDLPADAALTAWVRLGAPEGLLEAYVDRGGVVDETLDVLALDLADGPPALGGPADGVDVRWVDDVQGLRDLAAVNVEVFGGKPVPEEELEPSLARWRETRAAGRGGQVVAYDGGHPVGSGGVSIVDGDVRLWGGGVREEARGRGIYRAMLAERLAEGVRQGAGLALVKGRVETSGPILRRAGFAVYGREVSCTLAL
ncbi:GNAT family N-acetyltransferase [Nocardioides sp. AX2bis]|uniref:GNAT family N-acetyltransferase n=1 Tax=Nocardioides sp. AX2bis TaxID=2653157 RepID=UPI0012F19FDD|nr:GNAT family N-acetyltransferase [Nocardioides sp. AX2bis]VXB77120.1 conserved hypothetical protein [Nocardioides sp. AX2bis]